jgi:thermitase
MNRKSIILNLLAFMFCAILPMTPIMSAALNSQELGNISDLGNSASSPDLPVRSLEAERWDLLQIKAPDAWELASGGKNVIVAVLDDGIDQTHPALQGKVIETVNFAADRGIDTVRGHGTHIAGLIAAAFDQIGGSGLAYNAKLLDVKVAQNNGQTDALKVAKGIIWAADNGAQVINISVVISKPYPLLEYAVNYAWEKGCVIIAAAGNSASSAPVYPAAYPHVIAVASTDKNDNLANWSNHGDWVDVAAPGVDIYSTLPDDKYGTRSGTSFSTALVSGEAALLFPQTKDQDDDGLINREVENKILSSCDTVDGLQYPERRINAYNAARAADIIKDMLPHDDNLKSN